MISWWLLSELFKNFAEESVIDWTTGEAERIRQCRGRVFALHDEPEVPRVWLPFDDSPGLAMARAFGDFCLKDYGVIAVPEMSYRQLTERDQFIVLATDGVTSQIPSYSPPHPSHRQTQRNLAV
jgi:hypothetical protein